MFLHPACSLAGRAAWAHRAALAPDQWVKLLEPGQLREHRKEKAGLFKCPACATAVRPCDRPPSAATRDCSAPWRARPGQREAGGGVGGAQGFGKVALRQ